MQLGPNQSLRNLLCFSFRCEDFIRTYPWRKKKSDQWLGNYDCVLGKIWVKRGDHKQVWFFLKNNWGVWEGGSSANTEKIYIFYPHLSLEKLFPVLKDYFCYKTITSQNVLSEAQVKQEFFLVESCFILKIFKFFYF